MNELNTCDFCKNYINSFNDACFIDNFKAKKLIMLCCDCYENIDIKLCNECRQIRFNSDIVFDDIHNDVCKFCVETYCSKHQTYNDSTCCLFEYEF